MEDEPDPVLQRNVATVKGEDNEADNVVEDPMQIPVSETVTNVVGTGLMVVAIVFEIRLLQPFEFCPTTEMELPETSWVVV